MGNFGAFVAVGRGVFVTVRVGDGTAVGVSVEGGGVDVGVC